MRKVILDTDWWTDCDDAVAIRLLCNAHLRGELEILGININACMEFSVPSLDVFTRDCGVEVPLGIDHSAIGFAGNPPYQEHLTAVRPVKRRNEDVMDGVEFYRHLLAGAEDDSVEIASIGFTQVLAGLLESDADRELVARKVKHLWIMAGKWDEDGGLEYNFRKNEITRQAGALLCEAWPSEITFLGYEVGETVLSGGTVPEDDLLKQIMRDHRSENGRSSWDPMLVLMMITGSPEKSGYRCVYGQAQVDPVEGCNYFSVATGGKHRYVVKLHKDTFYADAINSRLVLN